MNERINSFRERHPRFETALLFIAGGLGIAGIAVLNSQRQLNEAKASLWNEDVEDRKAFRPFNIIEREQWAQESAARIEQMKVVPKK